jgi:tetratricopeptide (TPR) repeat protein
MQAGERSVELSYNLGLLLHGSSQHEAAAECYQYALEKKTDFADAWVNLGHALKAWGKDDEARAAWKKAVETNPGLAGAYFQ